MLARLLIPSLVLLALALPASAGARSPFVGVNFDGLAVEPGSVSREMHRAAKAGAGSVRLAFYWPHLQPYGSWAAVPEADRRHFRDVHGVPTDFRETDRFVRAAARARLHLTAVIMSSAPWAAEDPYATFSPPLDPAQYGRFARTLAERYGTRGRFWAQNRRLPRRPVRTWQIWNEPAGIDGFGSASVAWQSRRDSLTTYVALLRAARSGLKAADRSAHVMLSGLFGKSWVSLEQLYGTGARNLFDSVAVHPYTRKPAGVVEIVRRARAVMSRHGDRRKPISVTEVSWVSSAKWLGLELPFVTDEHGQAQRLERVYRLLAGAARRLRIERVQWYTWLTRNTSPQTTLDYAGLLSLRGRHVSAKPAYGAFKRVARRLRRVR